MNRRHNSAISRLKQDYLRLKKDPVPYITAEPLPSNLLEWHYIVRGPSNTPYQDGIYHGKLVFPNEFPYKPPSIYILTPNGRFRINTRLCLSISDFHPDTWNPAWSVATILTGLLSFMLEKNPTLGSIETSDYEKNQFAWNSLDFNLKDKIFRELFPDVVKEIELKLEKRAEEKRNLEVQQNQANVASSSQNGYLRQFHLNQDQEVMGSAWANIVVIIGFAVFACSVRYVLASLTQ
ncbi:hypothetical protein CHUAL_001360 [Chamberlinius hualienensis]